METSAVLAMPVEELIRTGGKEEIVGDGRDLLGLAPGLLQYPEFAFECPPLLLFVERHFEGERRVGFGMLDT